MALETLVGGAYTTTYSAVSVGITEDGFELQQESFSENVTPSDAYGQTLLDWFYRGGDVSIQFLGLAYKAGSLTPFWPWGALGTIGVIGRLASNVASAVVLTSTAGTPAATAPATLTGALSLLAPNFPARLLFTSKLRKVPIKLQLLPSGAPIWFSTT